MFSLIDSDKLQGVIRNPFAFYFPIQRGFSGSIQTLPSNSTDCEPMCSFVMFTRVLWRTLMKGSWSLFIELTQISISTKKKKAKLHYSGSKDRTNEQMFRAVLFSGLRDQFVVRHYCHNPSDKCK